MKTLLTLLTCLFLLSPNVVMSETVKLKDVVKRDGLYYQKSSDVPFTGIVTGIVEGKIKKGKKDGPWITHYRNGQLRRKRTYKDGKLDGPWVYYYENGQLVEKVIYKNGKKDGPWVNYWENGQLRSKGTYKDSKREGPWVFSKKNGTKRFTKDYRGNDEGTGTYKNGKKVSD